MNVAFFDNGNMGFLFSEISKRLYKSGHNIYIFCLSPKKAEFIKRNYQVETIYIDCSKKGREINILQLLEDQTDFNLNKAILMDRILKDFDYEEAKLLLENAASNLLETIKRLNINIIFGEITWAIEYLAYYLMQSLGRKYYNPLNTYVIPGRFLLLNNLNDSSFVKFPPSQEDIDFARNHMENRMKKDINENAKFLRTTLPPNFISRLKILFKTYDKRDYRYSLKYKKKNIGKFWNRFKINRKRKDLFTTFSDVKNLFPNHKYALLALHVQPEATPDVIAPEYSNQLELAKNIARNLPKDYKLLIKEHPNGIGSRTIEELREFRKIPNAILLDPYEKTNTFLSKIHLVFTIAGTISFEASLYGVPSIVFSDVYYNLFPLVHKIREYKEIKDVINSFIQVRKREYDKQNLEAYATIYRNSFEGMIYDPFLMPRVLEEENLKLLEKSFLKIIEANEV
jgi:hypothetical protein